jgi:hypothetical protein
MNLRVQPLTKEALRKAAKASGRTMSAEGEYQLHRALFEMSGPLWPYLALVNEAFKKIAELSNSPPKADDPALFDRTVAMLKAFRPSGPELMDDDLQQAVTTALNLFMQIKQADSSVPLAKQSQEQRRLVKLKEDLVAVGAEPILQRFAELAQKTRLSEKPPTPLDAEQLWQATRLLMGTARLSGEGKMSIDDSKVWLIDKEGKRK